MNSNLTDIAVGALISTPIMIALATVFSEFAWLVGAGLILVAVVALAKAFLDQGDAVDYIAGIVVGVFGLLTEIASVEGLVYLTVSAIIVDALFGVAERLS